MNSDELNALQEAASHITAAPYSGPYPKGVWSPMLVFNPGYWKGQIPLK